MKKFNLFLFALTIISVKAVMAQEPQVSIDEFEAKEEVARSLGLNAQQIEIVPAAVEYKKVEVKKSDGVNLKGRLFITWSVRDILATNDTITYKRDGKTYSSDGPSLDGTKAGNINKSVKLAYQIFEHLGVEASYGRSSSTMELASLDGTPLGTFTDDLPLKVKNDFQTINIGLTTNANLVKTKNFRMDLVAGVNAGMIIVDSTFRTKGDVYSGAIGYSYGAEASVKVIHKSGLYLQTGVGVSNKVFAPYTYKDGSESQFDGTDVYAFVNVGYSFGGKKNR